MSTKSTIKAVTEAVRSTVEQAALAAVERVAAEPPVVPGAPAPEPPSLEEPTDPQGPLPPKPDQAGPEPRTATGARAAVEPEEAAQQGAFLTTSQGLRLRDTDHSLKAGPRGPTLLQDHHLREKITHFDHERIPERVVHARGSAAHGVFIGYGNAAPSSRAGVPGGGNARPRSSSASRRCSAPAAPPTPSGTPAASPPSSTPTRAPSTWSATTSRSSSSRTGSSSPTSSTPAKPHPDREIPQAQSAHDTFWDFVSLHTEAQHHTIWNMSDRGIPRSYRTMEGFGVHTFRCVNEDGETSLVKFHWKPVQGVHSLVWEEAQLLAGHRSRLPPARPRRRHRGRRLPAVAAGHPGLRGQRGADVRGHRPAGPDQAGARGARAGAADRAADADREPHQLLRRDRAGRLPPRQPGARASTSPTTRCCRRGSSRTSTPS